jgi:hypothetical protein
MSQPIDVFVKIHTKHRLRELMSQLVLERLLMFGGAECDVILLVFGAGPRFVVHGRAFGANEHFLDESTYHIQSKWFAARNAKSDVYVVIDDDHLPLRWDWLQQGASVLESHPEFALVASWSVNGEVFPEHVMRAVPDAYQDDEVFETCGLGTPYFARRGQIPPEAFLIPGTTAHTYDPAMSDMARAYGKLGFLKNVRHNHLGIGFSTVSAPHWEATC